MTLAPSADMRYNGGPSLRRGLTEVGLMPVAPEIETGVLYCNENLERLSALPSASVDLIYLDPPFFSNRVYEVIWGDEAEVRSFEDRWSGGILVYIDWMRERVAELYRVLKPTGALYLHCDPHASHYLKLMLDEVFVQGEFQNEIVWKRTGAHSATHGYGPVHDLIFFYSRGREFTWNPQFVPYSEEYLKKFSGVDPDGRRFQPITLTPAGTRNGATGQPWRGFDPTPKGYHWKYTPDTLERLDTEGKIYWPMKKGGLPRLKQYLDEAVGVPLQDVWTDINPINAVAAERIGYPTQKPESLLERIITSTSNPGDVVLDPFCGCGTTIAVAERLNRQWIGIDISTTAMRVMRKRLWNQFRLAPAIVDMPSDEEGVRALKPFEFQNWVIDTMNGDHSPRKSRDGGIDGYSFLSRDPIQVKQSDHVGRETVDKFETAMRRGEHDVGYIVAFSFTKDAFEEAARAKRDQLNIKLLKVKEILLLAKRPDSPPKSVGPQPEGDILPMPSKRKPADLPSVEELIASDQSAAS